MKSRLIIFIVLVVYSSYGQSARPIGVPPAVAGPAKYAELTAIMHCLTDVELNWLGDYPPTVEKAKKFRVGLRHDRRTYPGDDVIFAVVFESPTQGDVFELMHYWSGKQAKYNLENNGSFELRGKAFAWRNEIFGGIWTHEYIERNIRKIVRGPKASVSLKTASKPITNVTCTYYGSN